MSDHDWCRDVRRDEQVRAAEDAAAVPAIQHRDLPEQVALLWACVGDLIGRVVRLEGEFDAGQDEEAAPAVCDSAHLDANRGESVRVVEETTIGTGDVFADVQCGSTADEIARLTAERDAARARVAVLEAALPPRGWLTAEERDLIAGLTDDDVFTEEGQNIAKALLARETPPRVKVPPASTGETPLVRDLMWGEAIRAAGGEVD